MAGLPGRPQSRLRGSALLYMAAAGASSVPLAVNALPLVMALALFAVISSTGLASRLSGGVFVALGGLLLATTLFGASMEGAARWIRVAGLPLQISLVVLPAMRLPSHEAEVSSRRSG